MPVSQVPVLMPDLLPLMLRPLAPDLLLPRLQPRRDAFLSVPRPGLLLHFGLPAADPPVQDARQPVPKPSGLHRRLMLLGRLCVPLYPPAPGAAS